MIRGIALTSAAVTVSATAALNSHVSVSGEPSASSLGGSGGATGADCPAECPPRLGACASALGSNARVVREPFRTSPEDRAPDASAPAIQRRPAASSARRQAGRQNRCALPPSLRGSKRLPHHRQRSLASVISAEAFEPGRPATCRPAGMPRSLSAFAIPVALITPSARIASITGRRSAVREAAFACRVSAALCRPNSANSCGSSSSVVSAHHAFFLLSPGVRIVLGSVIAPRPA